MWPMVPTFTCGFLRSNFAFAMETPSVALLAGLRGLREASAAWWDGLWADALRHRLVMRELHGEGRASLGTRAQVGGVAEHLGERHDRGDHLGVPARLLAADPAAAAVDV